MNTTGNALEKKDDGPTAVIAQYQQDFSLVLPTVFRPETFVRLAQGALRRDVKLRAAAEENPGSLLVALLDAARLGHEPGTHDFYLTPRRSKGKLEVLGIEGYRGIVKRMLNSPLVLSVVAEAVYSNDDFEFVPGVHERPVHKVDWFERGGDRGDLIGAYAYATLAGGATSKVAVVGPKDIKLAKASSDTAKSEWSPWNKHPEAMYRKTALRRLEPFVAKASEAVAAEQERTVKATEVAATHGLPDLPPAGVDPASGEVLDGELVDDTTDPETFEENFTGGTP